MAYPVGREPWAELAEVDAVALGRALGERLRASRYAGAISGFKLGVELAAAVLWVARSEVEGDTRARRVRLVGERWGLW